MKNEWRENEYWLEELVHASKRQVQRLVAVFHWCLPKRLRTRSLCNLTCCYIFQYMQLISKHFTCGSFLHFYASKCAIRPLERLGANRNLPGVNALNNYRRQLLYRYWRMSSKLRVYVMRCPHTRERRRRCQDNQRLCPRCTRSQRGSIWPTRSSLYLRLP